MKGVTIMWRTAFLWLILATACQTGGTLILPDPDPVKTDVWALLPADSLYARAVRFIQEEKPQHAMDGLQKLLEKYPSHPHAIDALLSMGKIYTDQFREYHHGLEMFQKVVNQFPDHPLTAQAYFMLGFINANYINRENDAREYYNRFLEKYPEHELAGSVRFELEHIGLNVDEILKISGEDSTGTKTDH